MFQILYSLVFRMAMVDWKDKVPVFPTLHSMRESARDFLLGSLYLSTVGSQGPIPHSLSALSRPLGTLEPGDRARGGGCAALGRAVPVLGRWRWVDPGPGWPGSLDSLRGKFQVCQRLS